MSDLSLAFGFSFDALYQRDGLVRLDGEFCTQLERQQPELFAKLMAARSSLPEAKEESQLLIELAPVLEEFIAVLFGIEAEMDALVLRHHDLAPLYACKRLFVQRRAAKAVPPDEAKRFNVEILEAELCVLMGEGVSEISYARAVIRWMEDMETFALALETATRYAAWALHAEAGQKKHHKGVLFKQPKKIDAQHLVPVETEVVNGVRMLQLSQRHWRQREGFALTDTGGDLVKALDEAHYCIFCHHQGRDSCSKGFREKDRTFRRSSLGVPLTGCPLEEKISEMNQLKAEAAPLGALAVAIVDNPMIAGTGHRICNDCMKSCIYQKQEPVNIPLQETRTLRDILELPWGFEIYSLLTRWNPLNFTRPLPRPHTGKKILIAGLGPAGYTLAHHLMNDGHHVIGIDGLKLEPLSEILSGMAPDGTRVPFMPIHDIATLEETLDERTLAGFGGVAEYGITVRWNKNYLKVLRLLLERRSECALLGGVRFGGTLTKESAFALGFDHIALCMGAGKPTVLDIPGGMRRGVRAASDFLMALQLTGAAKKNSIANLQLRLPVVVIGGGLTAIDTATEALAYYPVQVEKFLRRHEALHADIFLTLSEEESAIAEEFIAHAKAIRAERSAAAAENRTPDIIGLLQSWGGATIAYRKRLQDAPSYRLNHEEIEKAMEEGIRFAEHLEPLEIEGDAHGYVSSVRFRILSAETENEVSLPAKTVLIAAGTSPNTVLAREDESITLDGRYFQAVDENGNPVTPERSAKPEIPQMLLLQEADGRGVSFFGDQHPSFAGNVVKAMASAKQGYPTITRILARTTDPFVSVLSAEAFIRKMQHLLSARVYAVNRLTPTIIEVVVCAPLAAQAFKPGQFFRLQNFEAVAAHQGDTILAQEGLAMTGAWVNQEKGLIACIVLEMGGSSDLCALMKPGDPIVLMGPTGTPTEIPENETVLLAGGGLGNAVLFSIGKAMRVRGCKVLYFAGYRSLQDRYKVEEIEQAADVIVWCSDEAPGFSPTRSQDFTFVGNIVEAMAAYGKGHLNNDDEAGSDISEENRNVFIPLTSVQRIVAIGSDRMMAAVAAAQKTMLAPWLGNVRVAIGSINSPMQCMMKEICAQCLQLQIDPVTGQREYVFSCYNQDQPLERVSFDFLKERLKQNSVPEKQTARWIAHCLAAASLRNA